MNNVTGLLFFNKGSFSLGIGGVVKSKKCNEVEFLFKAIVCFGWNG